MLSLIHLFLAGIKVANNAVKSCVSPLSQVETSGAGLPGSWKSWNLTSESYFQLKNKKIIYFLKLARSKRLMELNVGHIPGNILQFPPPQDSFGRFPRQKINFEGLKFC